LLFGRVRGTFFVDAVRSIGREIQMRAMAGLTWLFLALPPSMGLAQESLCNPCVDPAEREFLPQLKPSPTVGPSTTGANSPFYLGASIANLRGLNTEFGARTLTLLDSRRMSGAAADGDASADGAKAAVAPMGEESREPKPEPEAEPPSER
jgi:hypothetical protein